MVTTPVIFLPGSLCDKRVFADQLREIDQPCEVADLTLDDSIMAMATRVLREAPQRFALVGLSLGGIVAAEIARLGSERVQAMALIDTKPRSATATAVSACKLAPIDERRFLFLVQQTPFFALHVMRVMASRLRAMDDTLS